MTDHIEGLLKGMEARDAAAVASHLADNITLLSPLLPDPFVGKKKALEVLGLLLSLIDRYVPKAAARDGDQALTAFSLEVGDVRIDGTDYVRTNAAGLIDYLSVCWRPLPEIVKMQNRLAPVLGIPALSLVESPGADD